MNFAGLILSVLLLCIGFVVGFFTGGVVIAQNTEDRLRKTGWTVEPPNAPNISERKYGLIPIRAARMIGHDDLHDLSWQHKWLREDLSKHLEPYISFQMTDDVEGCGKVLRATLWVADKGVH